MFHKEVFRMTYYRIRSRLDAEDLTQEVFIQAFRKLGKLEKVERFRAWLFSIALNRVRDFQRKRRLLNLFGPFSDVDEFHHPDASNHNHPEALKQLIRKDFWKQIASLLNKLSRLEREVFILRFMDHLLIAEIAQVLNKSESSVKTHLYRALKKFKDERELIQLLEGEAL